MTKSIILLLTALWLLHWDAVLCQTTMASVIQKDSNQLIKSEVASRVASTTALASNQNQTQLQPKNEPSQEFAVLSFGLDIEKQAESDNPQPIRMKMGTSRKFNFSILYDNSTILNAPLIKLKLSTLTPQFDILFAQYSTSEPNYAKLIYKKSHSSKYVWATFEATIHANYIGHGVIFPYLFRRQSAKDEVAFTYMIAQDRRLAIPVTVIRDESAWETVFIVSVTLLIVVSYINLGAQLDLENLKRTVKRPKTMLLGFLLTVVIMPVASWFTCKWLMPDQLLYRIGSFVFATTPAASASTLWTVMLDADKELSVSLQVLSTFGSLVSMPISLWLMLLALQSEGSIYVINVPYMKLIQSITVLLIALLVGWGLLGRNERLRKISSKVFKPFIFAVLFFIIIFSSTLYWFIYRMFNWSITFNSFLITLLTYVGTGGLGYLINFNLDHAITISISSAYKNSGIAFAVLLVAFEAPDYFIAYVPCLTQVVVTSLLLYTTYTARSLYIRFLRRNQPDPIQATKTEDNSDGDKTQSTPRNPHSDNAEEEEEFIDVNVTDVPPNSLKLVPPVASA